MIGLKNINKNYMNYFLRKNFSSNIQTIGVIGCGQMGTGIAYVFGK
jgi:hypothetical protein